MPLHLITVSHAPDVERCHRLCESIDRFDRTQSIQHTLICPHRDLPLFADLGKRNRRVISYQDILPRGYRQIPLLSRWWLDPGGFPVRGWMMQQLVKLAVAAQSDAEYIVIVDSDIVFCRSIDEDLFFRDGAIRLVATPLKSEDKDHVVWQRLSERLLWVSPQQQFPNYVGQLMSWSPDVVRQMLSRVEKHADKPWFKTLGRLITVSEYTLYSNFAEHLYEGKAKHFLDSEAISLDLWVAEDVVKLKEKQLPINKRMVAVLIQSNLQLSQTEENTVLQHCTAALQDIQTP